MTYPRWRSKQARNKTEMFTYVQETKITSEQDSDKGLNNVPETIEDEQDSFEETSLMNILPKPKIEDQHPLLAIAETSNPNIL